MNKTSIRYCYYLILNVLKCFWCKFVQKGCCCQINDKRLTINGK